MDNMIINVNGYQYEARRIYIVVNGMELEVLVTRDGVKLSDTNSGGISITPHSSNSIEIKKSK